MLIKQQSNYFDIKGLGKLQTARFATNYQEQILRDQEYNSFLVIGRQKGLKKRINKIKKYAIPYNVQKEGCLSGRLIDAVQDSFKPLSSRFGAGTKTATLLAKRRHGQIVGGRGGGRVVRVGQQVGNARFEHRLHPTVVRCRPVGFVTSKHDLQHYMSTVLFPTQTSKLKTILTISYNTSSKHKFYVLVNIELGEIPSHSYGYQTSELPKQ